MGISPGLQRTAADGVEAYVLVLPNPDYSTAEQLLKVHRLKADITFDIKILTNVSSLYTAGIARGDAVSDLAYVPLILPRDDPCNHSPALPTNVTRRENLSNSNFDLIALAPWISVNRSTAYLKAADEEHVTIKG
ncbi:hypothetical protein RUND412_011575, partial [Rhizina undulata]